MLDFIFVAEVRDFMACEVGPIISNDGVWYAEAGDDVYP